MIIRVITTIILGFLALLNIKILFFTHFDVTRKIFSNIALFRYVGIQLISTILLFVSIYFLTSGYHHLKHPILTLVVLILFTLVLTMAAMLVM